MVKGVVCVCKCVLRLSRDMLICSCVQVLLLNVGAWVCVCARASERVGSVRARVRTCANVYVVCVRESDHVCSVCARECVRACLSVRALARACVCLRSRVWGDLLFIVLTDRHKSPLPVVFFPALYRYTEL